MTETRVPAGVPKGGQFATSARPESAFGLGAIVPADPTASAAAEFAVSIRFPDVAAVRAGLASDEQRRLFDILVDPENDPGGFDDSPEDTLENLESYGSDSLYEAQAVADRLHEYYERTNESDIGGFEFSLERSGDYGVESYNVGTYLGHDIGSYLMDNHDVKYLDSRDAPSGLARALHLAEMFDGDYQRVLGKARKAGLLPAAESAPRKSPWPETDDERAAFVDWQTEASNGDTPASFRDWYENPDRCLDGEEHENDLERCAANGEHDEAASHPFHECPTAGGQEDEMHSVGNPACPAVHGGECSLPGHDEDQD